MSGIDQILSSVVKIFLRVFFISSCVVPTFHSRQELNSVQQWGSCTVVNKFLNKVRNNRLLIIDQHQCFHVSPSYSLRKKCSYSELFWSAFPRIRIEHGEIQSISPYSVRIRENVDQNNSEYGHFSRNVEFNRTQKYLVLSNLFYMI